MTQPTYTTGAALDRAKLAMIMIHGRGASAQDILSLTPDINLPDVAYLAPQAEGFSWYPHRFIAPVEMNEPHLSMALNRISEELAKVKAAGIPPERTFLLGFSQGACLATEYAARNPQRYGGIIGLSGGLIGEEGKPLHYDYQGTPLAGTPVFLGCSDVDFHIPKSRVEESAVVLKAMGGDVTMKLYPGMGHTVNQDEINFVRQMIEKTP